jgi:hypothetical protein
MVSMMDPYGRILDFLHQTTCIKLIIVIALNI